MLGRELPVVPRFQPVSPELLAPALAAEPDLGPEPDAAVESWLAQVARVRQPVDAWREVWLLGRALGRRVGRPRVAQLPADGAPGWAAQQFGEEAKRPRSGLVSLALVGADPPAADRPWAGLLLDTWPEVLPNREEETAMAFHFDGPRAEAPQAVLLAVPPRTTGTWSYEWLERTLLGTLELAGTRALDLAALGAYAQLLPMTYLAANRANQAVSTSFAGRLIADMAIRQD